MLRTRVVADPELKARRGARAVQRDAEPSRAFANRYGNQGVLRLLNRSPSSRGLLERSCCAGTAKCDDCARKSGEGSPAPTWVAGSENNVAPRLVHEVLSSPGATLASDAVAFMEPRFGYDFSEVRVHTNSQATQSARMVNALAYTVGRDIVFGPGQYAPHTEEGRKLLAHELAHVVQQDSPTQAGPGLKIGDSGSVLEEVAESVSSSVAESRGQHPSASTMFDGVLALQRQEDDGPTSLDLGFDGQGPGGGGDIGPASDCSGWERDPQSFSKRAAEFYIGHLVSSFEVVTTACSSGGPFGANWVCDVGVSTPSGTVTVTVTLYSANQWVRVSSSGHMICYYQYQCSPSGQLILSDPVGGCPVF